MAGLVPAIHAFSPSGGRKTWMPGTRPGMTERVEGSAQNRTGMTPTSASLLGLARILDGLEGLELDIIELAVDLLDLADVDVLHDVAGVRIDRDRAARAFPIHPFHRGDQLVAVG